MPFATKKRALNPDAMLWKAGLLLLLAAGLLAKVSVAGHAREAGRVDLSQTGWKIFTPPGRRPARFLAYENGVIEVRAESAVSFLYRDLRGMLRSNKVSSSQLKELMSDLLRSRPK